MRTSTVLAVIGALFAVAAALVISVVVLGAARPVEHQVTGERRIAAPCQAAWDAVSDYESQPRWRTDLVRVSKIPNRLGFPAWMEYYAHGERMVMAEARAEPPGLLVIELDDDTGPFVGSWTLTLEDADGGCVVRILEQGSSHNPMYRFVLHYLVGEATYLESYLAQLAAHLEQARAASPD